MRFSTRAAKNTTHPVCPDPSRSSKPSGRVYRSTDRPTDQPVGDRSRYEIVNVNVLSDYSSSSLLPSVCMYVVFFTLFFLPLSASFCVFRRRVFCTLYLARSLAYSITRVSYYGIGRVQRSCLHCCGRIERVDNFFEMRRGADARIALRLRFNSGFVSSCASG